MLYCNTDRLKNARGPLKQPCGSEREARLARSEIRLTHPTGANPAAPLTSCPGQPIRPHPPWLAAQIAPRPPQNSHPTASGESASGHPTGRPRSPQGRGQTGKGEGRSRPSITTSAFPSTHSGRVSPPTHGMGTTHINHGTHGSRRASADFWKAPSPILFCFAFNCRCIGF
jgi:hypothetical protein